jgi:hypothetical protein
MNLLDSIRVQEGVVIFDLDSTLLDNRPRQARILREFGRERRLPALEAARPEHVDSWDLTRAMRNAGFADAETWAQEARRFWRRRFFTSEYCAGDEAIVGAVDYVRSINGLVVYCTGRHEEMRRGTLASFERLGFPLPGERVKLLMKPTSDIHDDDYKISACDEIRALGKVIAAFDNEPTHANIYRRAFPDAQVVHLATDHSGRPVELLAGIVSIPNFGDASRR